MYTQLRTILNRLIQTFTHNASQYNVTTHNIPAHNAAPYNVDEDDRPRFPYGDLPSPPHHPKFSPEARRAKPKYVQPDKAKLLARIKTIILQCGDYHITLDQSIRIGYQCSTIRILKVSGSQMEVFYPSGHMEWVESEKFTEQTLEIVLWRITHTRTD